MVAADAMTWSAYRQAWLRSWRTMTGVPWTTAMAIQARRRRPPESSSAAGSDERQPSGAAQPWTICGAANAAGSGSSQRWSGPKDLKRGTPILAPLRVPFSEAKKFL
ncbi:hypothetical protein D3105_04020 [Streptomyces globisporus]|uniref:Uncharacterized protein n=1 Tax=Streptomyces globisporus TaxID=1908 RepID=A0A423V5H0_STRGL|nr:hypothetical protein D3105_04020 [Streptomyces globisporus]